MNYKIIKIETLSDVEVGHVIMEFEIIMGNTLYKGEYHYNCGAYGCPEEERIVNNLHQGKTNKILKKIISEFVWGYERQKGLV
jgi:hypothetical protein